MELKPIPKFDKSGGLYWQCPHEGCAWTFQFALNADASDPSRLPQQYADQLREHFVRHVNDNHSGL